MLTTFSTKVLDLIPHQVWSATPDGNLDYFNEQWFKYSKWDYEQSKGQGWALAIHPEDLPRLTAVWSKALETEEAYQTNARVKRHDGDYRWFNIQALPIYQEDGKLFKWLGTNTDIHDLVLTGTELDETKELARKGLAALSEKKKLNRFFMQAPAGICILDGPELVFELVNPQYQQFFPGRELLQKPVMEALYELKGQPIDLALQKVYATGETYIGKEELIPLYDEERGTLQDRFFDFIYQARRNEEGKIDGIMAFALEMTTQVRARLELQIREKELHALYNELNTAHEELQAANEEITAANEEILTSNDELSRVNITLQGINTDLDNFVYTASHDLKSPISNLEGLIHVLKEDWEEKAEGNKASLDILDLAQASIDRFKRTLHDLTDISRVQFLGHSEATLVSVNETLNEILLDLQQEIRSSKAIVQVYVDDCFNLYISRKNLRSILYNLVSNGIKYRNPSRQSTLEVHCREEEENHVIIVKDNGLGVETDKLPKLFTMFGRLHSHVEGSGVGLYMVKKIVENGGGRIEVASSPEGTTFTVYLLKREEEKMAL